MSTHLSTQLSFFIVIVIVSPFTLLIANLLYRGSFPLPHLHRRHRRRSRRRCFRTTTTSTSLPPQRRQTPLPPSSSSFLLKKFLLGFQAFALEIFQRMYLFPPARYAREVLAFHLSFFPHKVRMATLLKSCFCFSSEAGAKGERERRIDRKRKKRGEQRWRIYSPHQSTPPDPHSTAFALPLASPGHRRGVPRARASSHRPCSSHCLAGV